MKKVNRQFYVMRHSKYHEKRFGMENFFITLDGIELLKNSIRRLEKEILNNFPKTKRVVLIHSETPRAIHSALIVEELFNLKVTRKPSKELNCSPDSIKDSMVKGYLETYNKDEILLLLSHQPNLREYKENIGLAKYASCSLEIEVPENDGLPF